MTDRFLIIVFALVFGSMQNSYFGWNLKPQSDAELVCDGLTILMLCLAMTVKS